jgi:DNA-binding IclR family transcriptional regulator
MTTQTIDREQESAIFTYISESGPVGVAAVAEATGISRFEAERWLRARAEYGYLYRDAAGAFRTSCPWPRVEAAA